MLGSGEARLAVFVEVGRRQDVEDVEDVDADEVEEDTVEVS